MQLAWFGAVLFFSGIVQGVTGFGFGMVALALLALVLDVRIASASIAVVGLSLNLVLFAKLRREFRFDGMLPMLVAVAIASPLGVLFLQRAPDGWILVLLGGIMLTSFWQMRFCPARLRRPWHPVYVGVPCGLVGGWVGGAFGTGGPPLVAYLSTQPFNLGRYFASLQIAFAVASAARIVALSYTGFFQAAVVVQVTAGALIAAAGAALGLRLSRRIPRTILAAATIWFLGAMGVYYVAKGVAAW